MNIYVISPIHTAIQKQNFIPKKFFMKLYLLRYNYLKLTLIYEKRCL